TRDSISVDWEWEGRPIRFVDTAGMRRKARVQEKLEKLSVADTIRAITFAEVVILMMDKDNAFDIQDLQLADLVEREGRALIYVASKWDLEEEPQARMAKLKSMAEDKLPQLKGTPFVVLSSHSGRGVERLMPAVIQAYDTWSVKVKTKDLNTWLSMATQRHPPPAVDGKRIKPKYIAQTKARPPTFVLMASRAESMPEQYKRYLVNSIRESFDLPGTPIRLIVKSSGDNPYAEGGSKSGPERYKGDAKTAPRRVIKKAEKAEMLSNLPGKALEQKKTRKHQPKVVSGVKASSSKKAGSSIAVQKGARGGARQVSRSGRIRTGQKHAPKK
ncbi:GTPase, partial [Brevundimonas sp.]|uniref:GTPase n=1 Tax=Brevundimonas sp. TaxID=1871086 RepID=UPI0025C00395